MRDHNRGSTARQTYWLERCGCVVVDLICWGLGFNTQHDVVASVEPWMSGFEVPS